MYSATLWLSLIGPSTRGPVDWQGGVDHWDAERPREVPVGGDYVFTVSGSDTESTEASIDSESDYDLESLMDTDEGSDNESVNWENYEQELRSQLLPSSLLLPLVSLVCMCMMIIDQPHQFTLLPLLIIPLA